ncbi:CobW family GTP-binding protein [Bradyrhizobium mercantei]|uniref:CobW family GTP-binding protein n=1 Tax=Bradyrhizobium mercantei TaxID=1904807 RepID=UPI0009FB1496|nr:GTP-binding protein [Bradyrhizobium mercantei]
MAAQMTADSDTARSSRPRIPVTLVTGFLGSGKTTLINAALRAPGMERTIVVVNEFGEVGIDHQLVASSNDSVVVLENGCLCCTVRSDLVATLNALYHDRAAGRIPAFENVVIETSGLAEPAPVLQAFLSEPTLDGLYRVSSVVTLVDAVNYGHTLERHDEALRQIALADQIRLTKLDLVGPSVSDTEVSLRSSIARLNRTAEVHAIDWSAEALAALLTAPGFDHADPSADPRPWLGVATAEPSLHDEHDDHSHSHHEHDHEPLYHLRGKNIESFVLVRTVPLSRNELQFLLDGISHNLGPNLLRVKGLVSIADEPGRPAVIQGVQHLLHTMTWLEKWPDADQRTRIVFITQGIASVDLRDMIGLLDRVSTRTFKVRERGSLSAGR